MTLLATRGLGKSFGGLEAVRGVSLDVAEGEVRAIIGPNGAGKSTLVGMVAGRTRPSAGTIAFAGRDVTALPAWRRVRLGIAYTFQITSVFSGLTCRDNVALAAQHGDRRDRDERIAVALRRVGLADAVARTASALSYGHRRLLEVAMGLALAPRLLIMDEPTQGLAEGEIDGLCRLVRALRTETTVLLIEHNMAVVMALADRITVLDRGAVLAEGPPAAVRADAAVRAAYLGA
ncbi:MAG: ABC transporter ATP-binding protein [Alphaproteobacteria bacterium]|nr:ABC transporter ATP-binding protein [Alphaproteobacteria bacterium]